MFEVVIVEDNTEFNKQICQLVNSFKIQNKLDYKVSTFYDLDEELVNTIKSEQFYKVYILDIELTCSNGIQIANKIRNLGSECPIIIISAHKDEYRDQLLEEKIMFTKFIDKTSNWQEQLLDLLQDFMFSKFRKRILRINTREFFVRLQIDRILYIDYNERQCNIITKTGDVPVSRSLTEILDNLDERFMYCYKSKVVNTDLIERIDKKKRIIFLEDGTTIDKVSEQYLKKIIKYLKQK